MRRTFGSGSTGKATLGLCQSGTPCQLGWAALPFCEASTTCYVPATALMVQRVANSAFAGERLRGTVSFRIPPHGAGGHAVTKVPPRDGIGPIVPRATRNWGGRVLADWLQNRPTWPSVTSGLGRGQETDFDALAQRGGDPAQQPADGQRRGWDFTLKAAARLRGAARFNTLRRGIWLRAGGG